MAVGIRSGLHSSDWLRKRSSAAFWSELGEGSALDSKSATDLLGCSDDQLPFLLAAAVRAKERFQPGVITYSRKVFLPLTNLCRNHCGYCTFRREPTDVGARTMLPEEVLEQARKAEALGCREALFSLGDKPELLYPEMRYALGRLSYKSSLHYLEAMCLLVLRKTRLLPHANAGVMSAAWLSRLAEVCASLGLMVESTSTALLGTGAAHACAPDKLPARRFQMLEEAGRLGIPITTGLLIGIGETAADRVETLFAIRELHRRYGHVQEVIVQNFQPKPNTPMALWPAPSQGDMLRSLAVARLVLGSMNLQAPPNLADGHYEDWLSAGINDWGGVSPLTPDFINPESPWPQVAELERRTGAAGQQLRERLCVYPDYVAVQVAKTGLLAERVRAAAASCGPAYWNQVNDGRQEHGIAKVNFLMA